MTWPANIPAQVAALVPTLIGVVLLIAIVVVVLWGYRTPHPLAPALAVLRGTLQLAAISLILSGIISDPLWVSLGLLVMFLAAAGTVTRRLGTSLQHFRWAAAAMGLGITITLTIVFVTGAIELSPRYVLAIGGIIIALVHLLAPLGQKSEPVG